VQFDVQPAPAVTPVDSTSDLETSLVRTLIPVIVGAVAGWLAHHGIHEPLVLITSVITYAYYLIARILEHYLSPKFGWLLGAAKAPAYS
jgi:hypothetical protein